MRFMAVEKRSKAYFETALAEVWNEKFENFVDALRRTVPEAGQ